MDFVSTPSTATTPPPSYSFFPTQPTPPTFGAERIRVEASTPSMHVCQKCGNKSFWGSWLTPYTPPFCGSDTTQAPAGAATFFSSPFSLSTPSSTPFSTTPPPSYSFFRTEPTPLAFGNELRAVEASTPKMHVRQKYTKVSFRGSRLLSYASTIPALYGPYSWQGKSQVSSEIEDRYMNISSISAMPIYQDKSHEEMRWEDYQSPAHSII